MNYDQLAQRLVAQVVGQYDQNDKVLPYLAPKSTSWDDAKGFCNDGRVVLALMKKCFAELKGREELRGRIPTMIIEHNYVSIIVGYTKNGEALSESVDNYDSLAIAIVLACLDALEKDDD